MDFVVDFKIHKDKASKDPGRISYSFNILSFPWVNPSTNENKPKFIAFPVAFLYSIKTELVVHFVRVAVMRCPELYPPTPCPGSVLNTPMVTPRWGSPASSPALSRHSASLQRQGIVVPKTGTPVGMPIFAPRRALSNRSIPGSSAGVSLQRGISPLARAELTPQHSRQADHQSSGEDEEDPPPYPGNTEDTSGRTHMPGNVDSVLDQVREALESQRHSEARDNGISSDSDERERASGNLLTNSNTLSSVAGNTGPSDASLEVANNPTSSGPGSGHGAQSNNLINPWVVAKEPSRENKIQATTMSSIESVV